MPDELATMLGDLKREEVLATVARRLESEEDVNEILGDVRAGMEIVGERFSTGVYFIPDLVYSGHILKQVTEIIKPHLAGAGGSARERAGTVVLGTVAGDIHDIGLNLVDFMLDTNGFEVLNLGVDVPAQTFVETIRESGAGIVGLSGLLTLAAESMKQTVDAIVAAGLRDQVKIMIGGAQVDEYVRAHSGADAFGSDALAAVSYAKSWS